MNLIDINKELNTEEKCLAWLEAQRWPDKVRCLVCGNDEIYRFSARAKPRKSSIFTSAKRKPAVINSRPLLAQSFTAPTCRLSNGSWQSPLSSRPKRVWLQIR